MSHESRPQTAAINGPLWGARARDWADIQEGIVRPAYDAVLARAGIGADTAYCDIGCGAGMAAAMAVAQGARVSGIDAATDLLAIARERVPEGDFRQGDMERLPFADGLFDVVTGFNSFQFAGNPALALGEARRVTKPGGMVAMVAWGEPEGMPMADVIRALGPLLPPPPPGAGGPFALSTEAALRDLAARAGLRVEAVEDVKADVAYPDLATALRGLNSSGVAARAMAVAGEETVTAAHTDALAPFRRADGSYRIGATFRCLFTRVD